MSKAFLLGGTQIILGPSTVTEFRAGSFQNGFLLKTVGSSFSVEITDGLSYGIGSGYPISNTEIISVNGPAHFFLAAAGQTATVAIAQAFSHGATGLPTLPVSPPLGML